MPDYQTPYEEALLEARRDYQRETPRRVLRTMYREYALMLTRIVDEADSGQITAEKAEELERVINGEMNRVARRMASAYADGRQQAISQAIGGHRRALNAIEDLSGQTLDVAFGDVPGQVVEDMMIRRGLGLSENFRSIMNRSLQAAAKDVDRFLSEAVARGTVYDDAAKDLARLLARGDDQLLQALDRTGPLGEIVGRPMLLDDPPRVTDARTLLFNARRVVITELNTSFFESNRLGIEQSPVTDLVRWTLSSRHHSLPSSPDVCTVYANTDNHGYGPGLYHPGTAPPQPHPFCACSLSPTIRPPEQWGEPNRPLPDASSPDRDAVRRILEDTASDNSPSVTDARVERQLKMAAGIQRAQQVRR